jgi:anti-sigma factor RsiW
MAESADHITCQEVAELVTDYLEGVLPADAAELLEQHINLCEGCDWHVAQLRTTIATVWRLGEEPVPTETRERLLAVFRDWKRS